MNKPVTINKPSELGLDISPSGLYLTTVLKMRSDFWAKLKAGVTTRKMVYSAKGVPRKPFVKTSPRLKAVPSRRFQRDRELS